MIKIKTVLFVVALLVWPCCAELIIHIQNPWRDEPNATNELTIYGCDELGWTVNVATEMIAEGNDWYKVAINILDKNNNSKLTIARQVGGPFEQRGVASLRTMFDGSPSDQREVWISYADKNADEVITHDPLEVGATVLYFLNPWPEVSPKVSYNGVSIPMNIDTEHDGWYKTSIMGDRSSMKLSFEEYFGSSFYNSVGKTFNASEEPIDLSAYRDSGQILYIWPSPMPVGPPKIATEFPEIFGDAPFRTITALVRDQKADGHEFETNIPNYNVIRGMVEERLINGKIKKGNISYQSEGLESWFETEIIDDDVTNDTCIEIELRKTDNGGWEFDSDWYGGFFPIDDFNPHNEKKLPDYEGKLRNFHFTMELHTQFDYYEGREQIFSFTGDDDVWVFINGKLAIDLGAPHPPMSGSVMLDDIKREFDLEHGKTYSLDMFYCERQTGGSNFKMNTTINLRNNSSLFCDSLELGNTTKYSIKELLSSDEFKKDCGFNIYDSLDYDTVPAIVDFLITGPYFDAVDTLKEGTNFGGITVEGDSTISIDTAQITELTSGEYRVTFISQHDKSLSGHITFTINRLRPAIIRADTSGIILSVGDTTFYQNISLPVTFTSDTSCTIYYEIDDTASGAIDEKGTITLAGDTVTVKAWALSADGHFLPSDTVQLYFLRELTASWVKLKTEYQSETNGGTFYFGNEVDFQLETNCEFIKYTDDGSDTKSGILYTGGEVSIESDSPDELIVNTYAYGSGFEDAEYSFTLIRDTLPELVADTSADPHVTFNKSISVTLELSKEAKENRWKGVKIFYSTDGSIPDSSKHFYDGDPVEINKTTTLRAVAYSINAVESPTLSEKYIKLSSVEKGYYSDRDGNGKIETVSLKLSHEPESAPDSILVISPFDSDEKVLIKEGITLEGTSLTVSFEDDQFSFKKESTGFDDSKLAILYGDFFDRDTVTITDSVAPVILSGQFIPGEIVQPVTDSKERHKDTLIVYYSEDITVEHDDTPHSFKGSNSSYNMVLTEVSVDGHRLRAVVEKIDGGVPTIGTDRDSIKIDVNSITKDLKGSEQKIHGNRYGPLEVLEPKYSLSITAINPFNPDNPAEFPSVLKSSDLRVQSAQITIADFLLTIKNPKQIDGTMQITDYLGNGIISLESKEQSNDRIGCYLADTDDRTIFVFYWSGQNKQGRVVGSGSYIAQVSVKDPSGKVTSKQVPVGIQRCKK